jgi:hypothetical protein
MATSGLLRLKCDGIYCVNSLALRDRDSFPRNWCYVSRNAGDLHFCSFRCMESSLRQLLGIPTGNKPGLQSDGMFFVQCHISPSRHLFFGSRNAALENGWLRFTLPETMILRESDSDGGPVSSGEHVADLFFCSYQCLDQFIKLQQNILRLITARRTRESRMSDDSEDDWLFSCLYDEEEDVNVDNSYETAFAPSYEDPIVENSEGHWDPI